MKKILLFITALLSCSFAFAQQGEILYFDLEPDSTRTFRNWETPEPPICLDVDRDGLCEWKFWDNTGGHQSIVLFFEPNVHPFVDSLGWFQRLRVNSTGQIGDTIANLGYGTIPRHIIGDLGDYPDQMLALRYQVDDGYCYGWIHYSARLYEPAPMVGASRIDVAVHEMAYCTIPNYPLLIGQTDFTWDVEDNEVQALAFVHPNPTTGLVTITGQDLKQAEVFNILGQHVATAHGEGDQMTVDISTSPAGVYFVNITDGEGRKCVKKVVKE
jgi:hypothetical protein